MPFRLIRTSARAALARCFWGLRSSAVHAQGITDAESVRIAANCTARKSAGPHRVQ